MRTLLGKPKNAKLKKAFDAIDSSDQKARNAYLDGIIEKHRDDFTPNAEAMKKADDERKAREKEAVAGLAIDL